MKRNGLSYRGTRAEVVAALEDAVVYQEQFGSLAKAQAVEVAITCIVGGSDRVQVGPFAYEVTSDQRGSSTASDQGATVV